MKQITDKNGVVWLQSDIDPNYGIKTDLEKFPVQVLYGKYGDDVEDVMDDILVYLDDTFSKGSTILYSDFLNTPDCYILKSDIFDKLNPTEIKLLIFICDKILPKSYRPSESFYDLETLIKKFPRIVNKVLDCMEADMVVWLYPETELDMETQRNILVVLTKQFPKNKFIIYSTSPSISRKDTRWLTSFKSEVLDKQ